VYDAVLQELRWKAAGGEGGGRQGHGRGRGRGGGEGGDEGPRVWTGGCPAERL
jgi:hypothetical protein